MKNKNVVSTNPLDLFVYKLDDNKSTVAAMYHNNTLWLTQKQIAELFETSIPNVNMHIKNIYSDGELTENTTIKDFLITQNPDAYPLKKTILHYNLDMIIAVGYRISSVRATQFRIWATKILHEYIQKGFALDEERHKLNLPFDKGYFQGLQDKIKEIRISERKLYQQLKDIYMMSADYDQDRIKTILFFQKVQNKVHFAITGQTAAEVIYKRADSSKDNMGLTAWENSPDGRIMKQDVIIAKNYLNEPELKELRYIINMFLDFAQHRAESEQIIFMKEWEGELDKFLDFHKKEILQSAGSISHDDALEKAYIEYAKYRARIKITEKQESELEYQADIKELEKVLKDGEQ